MDRDKAEVLERMDRDKADVLGRMDRNKADVLELFKQSDERAKERSGATDTRLDRGKAELLGLFQQSDERNGGHHRETQAAIRELSYRVGRLEGAGSVSDSGETRPGRHSPRRRDNPSSAPDSESDRAQVVERYAGSMVPLAGGGSEPARAAGLARQAVPGQEQDSQQDGGTGPESSAEESPETAG